MLISGPSDGVATITLNRPAKRNALSIAVRDLVSDALDELSAIEDVRCVLLTGAGAVFCAGFDLAEFRVEELCVPDEIVGFQRPLPPDAAVLSAPTRCFDQRSAVVEPDVLAAETARFTTAITGAPRAALMSTKRKAVARAGIDPAATLEL